jgi:hypothetical protein
VLLGGLKHKANIQVANLFDGATDMLP